MVGTFGEVLVVDWGLALLGADGKRGGVAGTPGFMAPEQAHGSATQASDVFALGALLQWWLSSGREGPHKLPRPLQSIVARATAAEPIERYGSAESFAADLTRYLDGHPVSAHRETFAERLVRFARRYRVAILLVVGYLLMRITLLVVRGL